MFSMSMLVGTLRMLRKEEKTEGKANKMGQGGGG